MLHLFICSGRLHRPASLSGQGTEDTGSGAPRVYNIEESSFGTVSGMALSVY